MEVRVDDRVAAALGERHGYVMPVARLLALGEATLSYEGGGWETASALGLAREHVPELIRLLTDRRLDELPEDDPSVYAAVYAWRVLADLRAEDAIPALIELLRWAFHTGDTWVIGEVPTVLGMIGPPAVAPLYEYLAWHRRPEDGALGVATALAEAGERHPAARDRVAGILAETLRQHAGQDEALNATLVVGLAMLGAVEFIDVIREAFAADDVDTTVMGDMEDVEIALGLRQERSTPAPEPFEDDLFAPLPDDPDVAARKAQDRAKEKRRAQRKQARSARKRARRR